MRTAFRLCPSLLGACLLAGACGCSGQGAAVSTPLPALQPGPAPGRKTPAPAGVKQPGSGPAATLDRGGKLVAKLLEPSDAGLAADAQRARGPRDLPEPPALQAPRLP